MTIISFGEFKKIDLRVAKVISAERVENSEKLIKLEVSLGDKTSSSNTITRDSIDQGVARPEFMESKEEMRQIIAGIGKFYEPESLIGREIVIVANLEPRTLMGLESQGMLLAANAEGNEPVILIPEKPVAPGTEVR